MQLVLRRLGRLGPLTVEAVRSIEALGGRTETVEARTAVQTEDDEIQRARFVVSGWACRQRLLPDGRRQVFGFILPGDGIGVCITPKPLANATTIALTRLELVDASDLMRAERQRDLPDLAQAFLVAANEDERRLLDHLVRLGRLDAIERVAHLLLELNDRLEVVGLASGGRFPLPFTQEVLADALGLSVVHINRTIQELRRQRLVTISSGQCVLLDPNGLAAMACYQAEDRVPRPV